MLSSHLSGYLNLEIRPDREKATNVTIRTYKQRGGPIHIESERGTVSIVPEVAGIDLKVGRDLCLRLLRPHTAYVIDAQGVTPLKLRGSNRQLLAALLAAVLLGVLGRRLRRTRTADEHDPRF